MYLKQLALQGFRNYEEQTLELSAPKVILVGENGQGKSNLLEAVELLATLKSHRAAKDRDLVQQGSSSGLIRALVSSRYTVAELTVLVRESGRRVLQVNRQTAGRRLDFLGHLNAVQFSCLDLELARGAPELRRAWLDGLLVQLEPVYDYIADQYSNILRQRNALLKRLRQGGESATLSPEGEAELSSWDQQLATMGSHIIRRRQRGLTRLSPLAQGWHQALSSGAETLDLVYEPNLTAPAEDKARLEAQFLDALARRRAQEVQLGTTLVGPHRDEISLWLNQTPAKAYASQGQQRTLVLALKLAELALIESVLEEPPLLLLDDVLAELDLKRQRQLLEVLETRFQTLITATHLERFGEKWLDSAQIFQVSAGCLSPVWRSELI
ncbi:MAG: DNA replication/repair protein RecF [Cyanobacteria bacterium RI_101]|nr:DNA replication/repair protein RecF [Cyanobacteria bacterium RI_101]